jgi:hypothetical protein
MDTGVKMSELLSTEEIAELSYSLRTSFEGITYNKNLSELQHPLTNSKRKLQVAGLVAAALALIGYSTIGTSSVSPAWSATPLPVTTSQHGEIFSACSSLIPTTTTDPQMHLVDYRGPFGDAILSTPTNEKLQNNQWVCHFVQTSSGGFKAIDVNPISDFHVFATNNLSSSSSESLNGTTILVSGNSQTIEVPATPGSDLSKPTGTNTQSSTSKLSEMTVTASDVWNGSNLVDGIKIPASQILMGSVPVGTVVAKVSCPDVKASEASISPEGFYSIWIPSVSPECKVSFVDVNGKLL